MEFAAPLFVAALGLLQIESILLAQRTDTSSLKTKRPSVVRMLSSSQCSAKSIRFLLDKIPV
jgi:hypothetical protein